MKRIRPTALVFDYGNVLSAPQGRGEIEAMAALLNVSADAFLRAYWEHRLAYDAAALDPAMYWNQLAHGVSRNLDDNLLAALQDLDNRSWTYPAPVLPQWARALHDAGFKTALLSNMPTPVREYVQHCHWLPPFDQRTFSCDVRVAKPAPEIFRHCLERLGVEPANVLFLDDRPENVAAAETLGMHGLVYSTVERAARELKQRFDIPVPLVATLEDGNAQDS